MLRKHGLIKINDEKLQPLVRHFEYLIKLGEVRVTRVVSTLVKDGMIDHRNCGNKTTSLNVSYLPISMGYRQCDRRYLASLGYWVETTHAGTFKISREDGAKSPFSRIEMQHNR